MRARIKIIKFIAIASFSMSQSIISHAQEKEHENLLKVVFATGEYRPYSSEKISGFGVTTELISAICSAAGIQPQFIFLPWKRIEQHLFQGSVFAAFPYSENAERKLKFDFSEDLYEVSYSLVGHVGNPKTQALSGNEKISDLKDFRFGIIAGSFSEPKLKELGVHYKAVSTVDQLLGMLRLNRFDFYIDDELIVSNAAQRLFPAETADFNILKVPFDKSKATLMVSRAYPNSTEILRRFNTGLAKIKETGEYELIIKKIRLRPESLYPKTTKDFNTLRE